MKRNLVLPLLMLAAVGSLALSRATDVKIEKFTHQQRYADGAPPGATGAPDEGVCSNCHGSENHDGSSINQFQFLDANLSPVTAYTPGETYNVRFTVNNPATKKGFQTVALANLTQAGTMTASVQGGTTLSESDGRQYIGHNNSSNTTTNGWGFTWTAPATNVGPVTFYVASNVTDNDGTWNGDAIYTSNVTLTSNSTAGLTTKEAATDFKAVYAAGTNTINMSFNALISGAGNMNLVDLNGKSVYHTQLHAVKTGSNTEKVLLPANIQTGVYMVHLFVNNQSAVHKIMIQK